MEQTNVAEWNKGDTSMALSQAAIGHRLRSLREAQGLSQAELSRRTGISRTTYLQWEAGDRTPEVEIACLLCETMGYTLDWIYRGDASGMPMRLAAFLPAAEIIAGGDDSQDCHKGS